MKKLLLLMLMMLPIAFVSCGSGDDEPKVKFDKETIVGTWQITEVQGTPEWSRIVKGSTLTFNSDGTCSTEFSMEDSYKIEAGQVKTYYSATQEPMFIYELLSMSGNVYTVKMKGTLDERNLSTTFKMTKL